MTNGGVMIGSIVRARNVPLNGNPVRVTISAQARPSTVVPVATATARNRLFQATPQPNPE